MKVRVPSTVLRDLERFLQLCAAREHDRCELYYAGKSCSTCLRRQQKRTLPPTIGGYVAEEFVASPEE
jgi:hypothetical protein